MFYLIRNGLVVYSDSNIQLINDWIQLNKKTLNDGDLLQICQVVKFGVVSVNITIN